MLTSHVANFLASETGFTDSRTFSRIHAVSPLGRSRLRLHSFSEVPFGEGFLDLKKMVNTLRGKDPNIPLDLEMITREPLKVPIFTDQYWVTFEDMPAHQVAHIMDIVQNKSFKQPLPSTDGLDGPARSSLRKVTILRVLSTRARISGCSSGPKAPFAEHP